MNDDSMIKIMQSLGLDYSPAITSTLKFEKTVADLNKQLTDMKLVAMQSAKDINNAFTSQLGQFTGNKTILDQWGKPFKTIKDEAKDASKSFKDMATIIKESTLEQMKAQAATVQQRATTKKLSEEYILQASTIREELNLLQNKLSLGEKLTQSEIKRTQELKEQLDILRAQTRTDIADNIRESPSTFGDEWERRTSWFLTGTMFYGTINAAKEATQTIKDVEMGMVEIQRVMTDATFVFDEYRDDLFKLGVDYGQTFENVQQIALRWAQSGYNVADSLELTKTSLLALNTAELDAKNATESMIGIMAQWQLQAEDMALVMDKINITADRYSVTSQDLVDGLLRSSSAARNMNMSIEETIGLLTVMREASGRTGAEVGNALNSILSYITRGKSIDTLESLGIEMFTDSAKTQFRNAMDIFKDIHANWNSLSKEIQDGFVKSADEAGLFNEEMANALGIQQEWNDVQQRDASQAAAGVYRRNYFIGMIERMANVQGVLNNMMEAEGYSMRENADAMETLEKKQESLKASAEALAVAIGDAGLTGALKTLADGGTNAITSINNLSKGKRDFILATTSTFIAVKTLQMGMKTFGLELPGIAQMITSLTSGTWSLAAALKAGGAGIATFAKANAPLLVLSASIGAIVAITNHIKKQREEMERSLEVFQRQKEVSNAINELLPQYEDLAGKTKLTTEENQNLLEVKQKITNLLPDTKQALDNENLSLSTQLQIVKDLNEEELERAKNLARENLAKYEGKYEDSKRQVEEATKSLEKWTALYDELYAKRDKLSDKERNDFDVAQKMITSQTERLTYHKNIVDTVEAATALYDEALRNQNATLDESISKTDKATESNVNLKTSFENMISVTRKTFNELKTLNQAIHDVKNGKSLSIDTILDLIEKYGLSLDAIKETTDGYTVEVTALEDLRKVKIQTATDSIEAEKKQAEAVRDQVASRLENYGLEIEQLKNLAEARKALALSASNIAREQANLAGSMHDSRWADTFQKVFKDQFGDATSELNAYGDALNDLEEIEKRSKLLAGMLNDPNYGVSSSKSTSNKALESIDAEIRAIKIKNDHLVDGEKSFQEQLKLAKDISSIEGLNQQYRITGELIGHNTNLLQSFKNEQDLIHDRADKLREEYQKFNIDSWFDSNAEATLTYINLYNKSTKTHQEELDKVFSQMQKLKKAWMESNDEAKRMENTISNLGLELDKHPDKVKNILKEMIELEKRNTYLDLQMRQRVAQEQLDIAKSKLEKDVNRIQDWINDIQAEINDIQESERARQESMERSKRLTEISNLQNRYYALQHTNLANITEEQAKLVGLEREREQYLERQAKIQELQIKLKNLQEQKTIQQYTQKEDGTWDYDHVADQREIDNVNKQIEDLQKEHSRSLKDLKERTLEDLKKAQEDYNEWERQNDIRRQIEAKERRIAEYKDEINNLQERYADKERITKEAFAKEKQALDDYYYDINILTDENLKILADTYNENWSMIVSNMKEKFNEIISAYQRMVRAISGSPSSGSASGGGFSSSTSSYSNFFKENEAEIWRLAKKHNVDGSIAESMLRTNLNYGFEMYHEGGIVSGSNNKASNYINDLFKSRLQTNEELAILLKDEVVINPENFYKNFIPNMQMLTTRDLYPNIKTSNLLGSTDNQIPAYSAKSNGPPIQHFHIGRLEFPNVKDAKEIEQSIRDLPRATMQYRK